MSMDKTLVGYMVVTVTSMGIGFAAGARHRCDPKPAKATDEHLIFENDNVRVFHIPIHQDKPKAAVEAKKPEPVKPTIRIAPGPFPIFINDGAFSVTFEKPVVEKDGTYIKTILGATIKNISPSKIVPFGISGIVEATDDGGNKIDLYGGFGTSYPKLFGHNSSKKYYPKESDKIWWSGPRPVPGSVVVYRFDLGDKIGEMTVGWDDTTPQPK